MKQSPRRSLQPQDPVGFSLPVTQTQELTRGKCSPEQCLLFIQRKNIDFTLISASADIQELRERLPGAGLALPWAVAPHPRPTAGTEPPRAARVPGLEPAPARGWEQHCGLLPKLSARAVTVPRAPQR